MTKTQLAVANFAGLAAFAAGAPAVAQRQPDEAFHPLIGVAGVHRPEFRGSDDYEVQPLPFVGFQYRRGDMTLSMEGTELELDLIGSDRFKAGPIVGYRWGRDDDIENDVVRLLPTIDDTVEGGVFAEMTWVVGQGRVGAGVKVLADLGDAYGGYNVTADVSWSARATDRLSYGVGANVVWADRNYMETYFGVDDLGAAASGLAAYRPDAGIESVGLSANIRYRLSGRWGVAMFASYDRLLDQAADTPIVTEEGSENQARMGFAVYRAF
ncbi:putative MltA-interacting MipA family protein [Devosia sp. LC5]|uniref:MipA/OmpV family protein n=1 Tax=Devosia sp. LC5 TaxID=1502724 RepID=UPI0004E2911E|nr:MipA/OmpV family protein [Devosia sp. LC5]KFC62013.1 putative MltA-interacting MipA family protein [Devosia sp. LC5]